MAFLTPAFFLGLLAIGIPILVHGDAAFIGQGVPNFEIRDAQQGTDLLVKTPYLGAALAKCLGQCPAATMRGHGAVVVGETVARAVGRSIFLGSGLMVCTFFFAIVGVVMEAAGKSLQSRCHYQE